MRGKKAAFKIVWHRNQPFDFVLDAAKKTLHVPVLLPQVPARSPMYREFKAFLAERTSKQMLEHRRIDARKVALTCANKAGNVSVTMTVRGGDYEYAARKLVNFINEVFLSFLLSYFDYQVEVYELDPDRP